MLKDVPILELHLKETGVKRLFSTPGAYKRGVTHSWTIQIDDAAVPLAHFSRFEMTAPKRGGLFLLNACLLDFSLVELPPPLGGRD